MTKYLKRKDGKFAGSIGNGKHKVPTELPRIIPAPTNTSAPSFGAAILRGGNKEALTLLTQNRITGLQVPSTIFGINLPNTDPVTETEAAKAVKDFQKQNGRLPQPTPEDQARLNFALASRILLERVAALSLPNAYRIYKVIRAERNKQQ